ncbi:MAG: lactate racemase domain-containing protein [Litorilinea sp.]
MSQLPAFAPIRQSLTTAAITDLPGHLRPQLDALLADVSHLPDLRGKRIAVGVGSRGIGCIGEVVAITIEALRAAGADPFIVPAMGSHGGGTAEGQRQVLESYGIAARAPVYSDMDAQLLGETAAGMPVYFDPHANQADGVIVVNRIKPHTGFRGDWESGLYKMLAVGLGKEKGAATMHSWGLREAIPDAARYLIANKPILAGIAIVENGHHAPARLEAIPAAAIEQREPVLLQEAWGHLPLIPFNDLDLVVLQAIGKDISGSGMDLNVVGMWRRTGGLPEPRIRVLAALDLTPKSHGNAVGVGFCDLIPQRLADQIDIHATYTNCLTAGNFNGAKIPITLPNDRSIFDTALAGPNPNTARAVIVRNTLDLDTLWVSQALLAEVATNDQLTQLEPAAELIFDAAGGLRLSSSATQHA